MKTYTLFISQNIPHRKTTEGGVSSLCRINTRINNFEKLGNLTDYY